MGGGKFAGRRPSRQVRRAEARREFSSHPPPVGRPEVIIAVCAALAASLVNLVAFVADVRAFEAVATPTLVCWLILCLICSAGLLLLVKMRRSGLKVPFYFRALLVLGALMGVSTLSPALRVLRKDDAEKGHATANANQDYRNRLIDDTSFAGRSLRNSNFSGATLRHVDLSGTDLSESDFRNATFQDVNLSGATLCGADIRGANMLGAKHLGSVADWSYVFYSDRTTLPKSQSYILTFRPGPVPDTGRDLLYMCGSEDLVQRIHG